MTCVRAMRQSINYKVADPATGIRNIDVNSDGKIDRILIADLEVQDITSQANELEKACEENPGKYTFDGNNTPSQVCFIREFPKLQAAKAPRTYIGKPPLNIHRHIGQVTFTPCGIFEKHSEELINAWNSKATWRYPISMKIPGTKNEYTLGHIFDPRVTFKLKNGSQVKVGDWVSYGEENYKIRSFLPLYQGDTEKIQIIVFFQADVIADIKDYGIADKYVPLSDHQAANKHPNEFPFFLIEYLQPPQPLRSISK
jgi:hypothetical protein